MRRFVTALAISSCALAAHAAIPQSQRDALLAFYSSTNGSGWTSNSGWGGLPGSECTWQGVSCDSAQNNVTGLSLYNNKLAGPLPATIQNLSGLLTLNLGGNQLTGAVPPELGTLTKLGTLSIASSGLSGPIPLELGSLSSLVELDLSFNQLTGSIPTQLSQLSHLTLLNLSGNQLTGILPSWLANLSQLEALQLDRNQLSGPIPPELGSLSALQQLNLELNALSGTIPAELGSLSSLRGLTLGQNQLSGPFPATLGNLTELQVLDLDHNQISGNLSVLANFKNLQFINLAYTQFSGTIPHEIGQLTQLQYVELSSIKSSGAIPQEFWSLTNLQTVDLSFDNFSGQIPASIGQMKNLTTLSLEANQLTGVLPPEIGSLPELTQLVIYNNAFSGPIPDSITNLTNLTDLILSINAFTGSIPASIGQLTNLRVLDFSYNQLSGTLPPGIGNLHQLLTLYLFDNQIEGSIPSELWNLAKLQYLRLGSNRFTGAIPRELGALTQLQVLDIDDNALRGAVPIELMSIPLADHLSQFDHNLLYTSDAGLNAFLEQKQFGGGWALFQTVTPNNVSVISVTDRSATIGWDITTDDSLGGYRVIAQGASGGPPVAVATTPFKGIGSTVVRGLAPETQYSFTVSTLTTPVGLQKNLLISDPSPAVSATTTARVISPPDVAVSTQPGGLVQIDGTPANQDSFTLTNYGDSATTLTLTAFVAPSQALFFSVSPATITLGAGESNTVTLSSISQPPGTYFGSVSVQGTGAVGVEAFVELLSVVRPAGTVSAEAVSSRVEVTGLAGSDLTGSVAYKNTGTAPLSGLVVSDVDWIQPSNNTISIFPGLSASVPFTIIGSKRPPDPGSLSANLRLIYVGGTSNAAIVRALDTGSTPVSVSVVTVVSTNRPPTSSGAVPPLDSGALAFFAAGVESLTQIGSTLQSDLSITNISSVNSLSDLKVFFTPAGSATSTVASFPSITIAQPVNLANVLSNVYGSPNAVGTLQIRGASLTAVTAFARLGALSGGTSTAGDVPILRSDRSADSNYVTILTGLRGGADLYIQETSGQTASVSIDFTDASGAAVGTTQVQSIGSLALAALPGLVPTGAVTARITNRGPGLIGAYGRVSDTSGDTWSIVDWRRLEQSEQHVDATSPLRIPFTHGSAPTGRRRAVTQSLTASNQSDVFLFNPGDSSTTAQVDVLDPSGSAKTSTGVTVASHQTLVLSNIGSPVPLGQVVITPHGGPLYATCRDYHAAAGGTVGAAIPVLPRTSGIVLGQSHIFTGLEDPTSATIAAAAPGTYRSALALIETAGHTATVQLKIAISPAGSLVAALLTKTVTLQPNQQLLLDPILAALAGSDRDTAFGDLHGMKLEIDVTSGDGVVLPLIVVTDNGSGDTYVRLD